MCSWRCRLMRTSTRRTRRTGSSPCAARRIIYGLVGTRERPSFVDLGTAPQRAELVRQASLPPAVLLLRLQAQPIGHPSNLAGLPNEPVLVPSAREPQPARGGLPGVGAPVLDRG